jgi:plastocyanin
VRARIAIADLLAVVTLAAAAAGGAAGAARPGAKASPVKASAGAAKGFNPGTVTARPGARVYFRNVDHLRHNAAEDVLSGRPRFRSGRPTTRNFSFVAPSRPGTYDYRCQVHGFMRGTLVVRR